MVQARAALERLERQQPGEERTMNEWAADTKQAPHRRLGRLGRMRFHTRGQR